MSEITINAQRCTTCGACRKICPAEIFRTSKESSAMEVYKPKRCIVCGHCVAACHFEAIDHSDFPASKVHLIEREVLPSPQSVMLLMKARRSNRALSKKPVPKEFLQGIVEAAHSAPTASNLQGVGYTIMDTPEKLRIVQDFTMANIRRMLHKLQNPLLKPIIRMTKPDLMRYVPVFKKMDREYAAGKDIILREATALIFIHTPSASRFGCEDANLAYQNGSLYAEALGVSQIYTGFVITAIRANPGKLEKLLGIQGTIYAGMALGMPSVLPKYYIERKALSCEML